MRQPRFSLEDRVRSHTNMLLDPCGSVLGQTAYRGMDGFVNRFVNTNVLPFVAGKTGFIHTFYPAYNSTGTQVLNAADSVPVIPLSVGPGQGFMLQNASSQRAIAACCSVTYTGTELNRSGSIYMANLPLSALEGNKSPNELLRLCQHVTRTPDSTIDVKWNPSPIEEEYWTVGAAAPTDGGARNVIVIVGVGFASDTVINVTIRNTLIVEWLPQTTLGFQATNPSSPDVPGGLEKVRTLLSRAGDWWVQAAHTAAVAGNMVMRGVNATRGAQRALGGARAAVGLLTL
jgi:hypothetical protein